MDIFEFVTANPFGCFAGFIVLLLVLDSMVANISQAIAARREK